MMKRNGVNMNTLVRRYNETNGQKIIDYMLENRFKKSGEEILYNHRTLIMALNAKASELHLHLKYLKDRERINFVKRKIEGSNYPRYGYVLNPIIYPIVGK
jgi:hypothetical protein